MNKQRKIIYAFGFISILLPAIAIGSAVPSHSPQRQITYCLQNLDKYIARSNDEEIFQSIKAVVGKESEWPGIQVTHREQLVQLQTLFVEGIANAQYKAQLYLQMAGAASKLHEKTAGLEFLRLGVNAAEKIPDAEIKGQLAIEFMPAAYSLDAKRYVPDIFSLALAAAKHIQHEGVRAHIYSTLASYLVSNDWNLDLRKTDFLRFVSQIKNGTDKITDERYKAQVYNYLPRVAGRLDGSTPGFSYLEELKTAADSLSEDKKAEVYAYLATGVGGLNDKDQGVTFLETLKTTADALPLTMRKVVIYESLAKAYAQLGATEKSQASLQQALDNIEKMQPADIVRINPYLSLTITVEELPEPAAETTLAFLTRVVNSIDAAPLPASEKIFVYALIVIEILPKLDTSSPQQTLALLRQLQTSAGKVSHDPNIDYFYQVLMALDDKLRGAAPKQPLLAQMQAALHVIAVYGANSDAYEALARGIELLSTKDKIPLLSPSERKQALSLLTRLQDAAQLTGNNQNTIYTYRVLALIAGQLGEEKKVLAYSTQALNQARQQYGNTDIAGTVEQLAAMTGKYGQSQNTAAFLSQLETAAAKTTDLERKIPAYKALITAANKLGKTELAQDFLSRALNTPVLIDNEPYWEKLDIYYSLAETLEELRNVDIGQTFLASLQHTAERMSGRGKFYAYVLLAKTAENLGIEQTKTEFLQKAAATAVPVENLIRSLNEEDTAARLLDIAKVNAKTGNYQYACNLANQSHITTAGALTILTAVLQESAKTH